MELQVIQVSDEYRKAMKVADGIVRRAKQDRQFEKNMMIKQKIRGVIYCLISIGIGYWLSEGYGLTPIFLETVIFTGYGLFLVTTKHNLEKELRESMKHDEEIYREIKNR